MKIFLDTADVVAIRRAADSGLLDGVTTNPTHLLKTGQKLDDAVREICQVVSGPVSVEAVGETSDDLIAEAVKLAALAPNVVIKMPMTVEGLKATQTLQKSEGVRVNVTMVFSPTQAMLAMKAGASFVSIVLSRLDAVAIESDRLILDTMAMKRQYDFGSEVIAASLKTQNHVLLSARAGADIITIPESLFFQMFLHPLTDAGLAQFAEDCRRLSGRQ
jgi:transaldolase